MQKHKQKRLRWDRIAMVGGVALVAAYGLAAVVPDNQNYSGTDSEGRVAAVLAPEAEADNVETTPVVPEPEVLHPVSIQEVPARSAPAQVSVGPAPSGPMPRKGIAPCSCSKYTMKLARNPYTQHQKRARSLPGSFFVKNESELQAGFSRGDLIRVPTVGDGYHLDRLTHSEPFLLPSAFSVLQEMAARFQASMKGTSDEGASIRITSLTRTQTQQRKLRRRNANAFNGQSTHNYGASFDVAFIDRPNESVKCGGPSWALQSILQDMQKNGEILVIPEGNCMHITPRNS